MTGMHAMSMNAGNSSKNSMTISYAAVFLNLKTANPMMPAV
jgi:hypothetical protein